MPPQKKKKSNKDEKQSSLDSFFGPPKKPVSKPKERPKKREEVKKESIKIPQKKERIIKPEEKIEEEPVKKKNILKNIPQELFFKGNDATFGLKEGNIELEQIERESFSSKYLRYLIKKDGIVKNMERGILIDVDYDGKQNKAYCKFYDLKNEDIKIWIDTTNHEPYCYSKLSKGELERNGKLTNYQGFNRFEEVKRYDLLRDEEIDLTKIYGKTPMDIGGSGENIKSNLDGEAWEADIRYFHNYIYDTGLVPGLEYSITKGKVELLTVNDELENSKTVIEELLNLFKEEKPEMQEFAKRNLKIFLTPISDIKRMALDIEVEVGAEDYIIPNPRQAKQRIISVSFVSNDGLKLVYVLERDGFSYGDPDEEFPSDGKVVFFKSEKTLLTETFRLMWEYPIVLTFNGDNFDLNYMFHRANKLKIDRDLNPIHIKRGFGRMVAECNLRKGIHVDIFNFFSNRSISGYAFGGAYGRNSLNAISSALLKDEKYQHEEDIQEMEYNVLAWYNLKDSILTLDLTTFNNNLAWNLIILLCRMTKLPMHDMIRHQISAWIRNIFFFEHRQKKYLIPRRSELRDMKPGGKSRSIIEGKGFQGAHVIPPVPGIHYEVVVMDFACFSEDTEILTNKGWFTYSSIKENLIDDFKIATVNPKNNIFEYQPIKEVYEYDYDDVLLNFKHQGINILVTPNHRMVYNKRTNERDKTSFENKISIKPSNELMNDYLYAIPYTGKWKGKSKIIQIGNKIYQPSDFLPFYGWFITDGGISGRSVNIYQSKKHNFKHIRNSLDKLGLKYKEYERNRPNKKLEKIFSIHNVEFRDNLKKWIRDGIGRYERSRIHPEIFDLKKEELLLLFESMILGDGGWYENKCYTFDNSNEDLANDFQILCLKIGYGCNIKKQNIKTRFENKKYNGINYRCKISYYRKNIIRKQHCIIKKYKGKVWCVSVDNGTLIARRKGKPFVSGNSLYPSIIKEYNLSYETVSCPHNDCTDNLVKGTRYHTCSHKMGIFAYVVGFFRDIRVKYFKPKSGDKNISPQQRSYYNTIQQAVKVLINGCLPYDEEVIVKDDYGRVFKEKIGDLEKNWDKKDILSIERNQDNFGTKKFVKILGFKKRKTNEYMKITLSDGRMIKCTKNHIIPKIEELKEIKEVTAEKLEIGDEIFVYHSNPLNENQTNSLFIPDYVPTNKLWISLDREEYKKYSYRTNESSSNIIINIINKKFKYSKGSKKYKCLWIELEPNEKEIIIDESKNNNLTFRIKYGDEAGKWFPIFLDLSINFFRLLGWYIAEGHSDNNRINITQKKSKHPNNFNHIISLLESLNLPYSHNNNNRIRINSSIIKEIMISLCSHGAANKKIPLELLNFERAKALLEDYYRGDGNLKKGKWKRYTTISSQLKNDLLYIIGALGNFSSVVNPKNSNGAYRIIETEGRKYRRKSFGLVDLNGTTPVRIKNLNLIKEDIEVFDIETENGWFISTNGIIVHNSYGVFGSENFPLFCLQVAESTTGMGRYSIKATIEKSETMNIKVLYGDTDSVFLLNPSNKQLAEISKWSKKELDLDLEEEKTYQFLALSKRKKNYIGIYKDTKSYDMKGLVAKKRNTPNFIKKVFSQLINILKEITNDDEFQKARNEIIELVRSNQKKIGKTGTFTLEDYAINIVLKKKIDDYVKVIPQHVSAARLYIEKERSEAISANASKAVIKAINKKFQKGSVITFVKTKGSAGAKVIDMVSLREIDPKKYQALLKSALEQVLDALDISFDEIKGIKKMDAFF